MIIEPAALHPRTALRSALYARLARAATLAAALAACGTLGCERILGIHDVVLDEGGVPPAGSGGGGGGGGAAAQGGGGAAAQGGGGAAAEGGGGGNTPPQVGFSIALDPAAPRVVRGGSAALTVTVARSDGFTGDVEISLADLPVGVAASPVVVSRGETTGVLMVTAEPLAALGAATASLQASAAGLDDRVAPVPLLVADPPGTLDQTLDGDGIATSGTTHVARAVAVQEDGKIVVAGVAERGGSGWVLARFLPSGALDAGFGAGGVVVDPEGTVNALALQRDGRILVVGTRSEQLAVYRFNTNGGSDQAFGSSGVAALEPATVSGSEGFDVAVQSSGAIIAVGAGTGNRGIVARFSTTGDLDSSFGSLGVVFMDERPLRSVALGEGDRIVAGGRERTAGPTFLAARLDRDGSFDAGFGTGGVAYLAATPYADSDLALGRDGKPVLVGYALDGVNHYAFARFNADGSPDATFGGSGLVNASGETTQYLRGHGVAIQADGKILGATAGGTAASGLTAELLRLQPDGTKDPGFGTSGSVVLNDHPEANALYAVAVQRDGRIVAAGHRTGLGLMVVRVWD